MLENETKRGLVFCCSAGEWGGRPQKSTRPAHLVILIVQRVLRSWLLYRGSGVFMYEDRGVSVDLKCLKLEFRCTKTACTVRAGGGQSQIRVAELEANVQPGATM